MSEQPYDQEDDPSERHAEKQRLAREVEEQKTKKKEELAYVTTTERCDGCGAQSYYLILLPGEKELYLCYHHYRVHEEKLFEVAEDIIDESELLTRR